MNIFQKFKIDKQIRELTVIVDLSYKRFVNFYESNFRLVNEKDLTFDQRKLFRYIVSHSEFLQQNNTTQALLYKPQALEEFEHLNRELGEEYDKLMQLFGQVGFDVTNTRWDLMAHNYDNIMNRMNNLPKFEDVGLHVVEQDYQLVL